MTLLAELTVAALLVPLAMTPPAALAPAAAPAPAAPVVEPSTVIVDAPAGSTVVVSDWAPTTTTTTTTTTTATTTTTTIAPPPAPTLSPKAAVRTLLRYDPYIAPRYRSGRNMMIGGGVMLGVGSFTLLSTLSWLTFSRQEVNEASSEDEHRRLSDERNQWINTARVIGLTAAVVAVTGVVLFATGAVRRRRAIEEARGRVFMQAGPGGVQVRF